MGLKSMQGTTTGKEIFEEVSKCVTAVKLPWDKLVALKTDGAPAMSVQKVDWWAGSSGEDVGRDLCR